MFVFFFMLRLALKRLINMTQWEQSTSQIYITLFITNIVNAGFCVPTLFTELIYSSCVYAINTKNYDVGQNK